MAESDPAEISTLPSSSTGIPVPDYAITTPVVSRFCEKAQKVRALAYNDDRKVRLYDSWMLQESLLIRKCRGGECIYLSIEAEVEIAYQEVLGRGIYI